MNGIFDKESIDKAARAALNPFIEEISPETYAKMVESVSAAIRHREKLVLDEVSVRIASMDYEFTQTVKAVDADISGK